MTALDDLISRLDVLSTGDWRWELKKLRAIRDWAYEQAGIWFKEGNPVRIRDGYAVSRLNNDGSHNGWWHYRECLTGGATGTAVKIDFSPYHSAWYAEFRPDREWSAVSEMGSETVRYWHGPAADTPEGYKPPSEFDQEKCPDGRKHTFFMRVTNLEPA